MLRWAITFFVLALIAGVLGFGGLEGNLAEIGITTITETYGYLQEFTEMSGRDCWRLAAEAARTSSTANSLAV